MMQGKGMPMMQGKGMPMMGMMGGMPGKGMAMPQQMQMMGMRPGMPAGAMMGGMPGKGMPGAMMGGMPGGMPGGPRPQGGGGMPMQGQPRPPQQMAGPPDGSAPLTASALAAAPPGMQKQMLGEKLFPMVAKHQPELAGKVTGMMLEMDNGELLMLLESEDQLKTKVDEALRVLQGK